MPIPPKPKKVEAFIAAPNQPEPKKVTTTIQFAADFVAKIDAAAREVEMSRNAFIRLALCEKLKRDWCCLSINLVV